MKKILTSLTGLGALALTLGLLAAPSAQAQASATVTLKVDADVGIPGTATLHITAGDSIKVTATGTITGAGSAQYGYQGAKPCGPGYPTTQPDGSEYLDKNFCGTVPAGGNAPMPNEPVGMLLGRTHLDSGGYTDWFIIAASRTWIASNDGTLDLIYNDSIYSDNTGYYTAIVTDNG